MLAGNDAGEQVLSVHNPDQMLHRNVWISSWVLTISLLGDALLYVILPVHAAAFGLSIGAVGFLLAINRIIRTFTYGLLVSFGERIGSKNLAFLAASTAAISTLGYGLFDGVYLLAVMRILWGLSYAGLLIVTLHYASANSQKTGTRIGISRSVEQIGPLLVMSIGTWLAVLTGPQEIFIYVGLVSVLGIALAGFLASLDRPPKTPSPSTPLPAKKISLSAMAIPRPKAIDGLIFWMGFGIDGVFTVTISLMWIPVSGVETAIIIGGLILAIRRVGEMVIAPISGRIADRFGLARPLLLMVGLCAVGFFAIGMGYLVAGSAALVLCRGALGTLFAAGAAKLYQHEHMRALTRNQTWRDIGAAAGPLSAGLLLGVMTAQAIHLSMLVMFMASSGWFFLGGDYRRLTIAGQHR